MAAGSSVKYITVQGEMNYLTARRTMATSKKDSGYVDNWQTGKTVTECNLHMLTTEDCSDVIFRVGSEKQMVRAHRYVLVSRSCVFHAMFCGPLAEKGEITVPDIEPDVFREFLRYVYTDTTTLTADTVTGLLYTSRKYAVDALQEMCVTFLEKSLSEDNVCQILEHCHGYGESDLEQKALKMLTTAGVKVIKSPGFKELCSDCLEQFLKSDELNLKEEEIFEAVLSWTKTKCTQDHISVSPENLRKCLGEMRYEIRFTEFPLEYLVKVVGPSGLLTVTERMQIVDRSVDSNVDISPFKHGSRKISKYRSPRYCHRFTGISPAPTFWMNKGKPDAISFTISQNINLLGCQQYGPFMTRESPYSLNVVLYDDQDQVIAQPVSNTDRKLRGKKELNDVMFPDPVPLVAGRTYTICVTMTGENTFHGVAGQSPVTVDGVTFIFTNSTQSVYTSLHQGQIPGLIWS